MDRATINGKTKYTISEEKVHMSPDFCLFFNPQFSNTLSSGTEDGGFVYKTATKHIDSPSSIYIMCIVSYWINFQEQMQGYNIEFVTTFVRHALCTNVQRNIEIIPNNKHQK